MNVITFITMIHRDVERCLQSLALRQDITVNGLAERGLVRMTGVVRGIDAIAGTDPICWRITIEEPDCMPVEGRSSDRLGAKVSAQAVN
jgi:hypothetical protein